MPATPAWPPRSAPRLFVPGPLAAATTLTITGDQAHYLTSVMRMEPGRAVILCDDMTGEWVSRVISNDKRRVELFVESCMREREQVPDFVLYVTLIKKPRFELILEKATELGVRTIQPVTTRRSVVDKLNFERARTIVTEAAEQCARTALPDLAAPLGLNQLLGQWQTDRTLFFADECGGEPAMTAFSQGGRGPAALLIGPEGGFDDQERAALCSRPFVHAISLGPRILRAETAAIAGTSLWMAVAGDWK